MLPLALPLATTTPWTLMVVVPVFNSVGVMVTALWAYAQETVYVRVPLSKDGLSVAAQGIFGLAGATRRLVKRGPLNLSIA